MFYIVSYDIGDDHRRTKIARTLEDFGTRVQYSVFECLLDRALFDHMVERLKALIKEDDGIRFYSLCSACERNISILGKGHVTKDEKYYIL